MNFKGDGSHWKDLNNDMVSFMFKRISVARKDCSRQGPKLGEHLGGTDTFQLKYDSHWNSLVHQFILQDPQEWGRILDWLLIAMVKHSHHWEAKTPNAVLLLAVGKAVHVRVDELVQIHRCTQLVAFWCTRPWCPGLPPFSRAGEALLPFWREERENTLLVGEGHNRVSLAVAGFKRAWGLPDPLREEFSPKPPRKQEAGLS